VTSSNLNVTVATPRILVGSASHFKANSTLQLCHTCFLSNTLNTIHRSQCCTASNIDRVFGRPTFQQTPPYTALKTRKRFNLKFLNSWGFVQLKKFGFLRYTRASHMKTLNCMSQAGPPSLHYYFAVVLHSSILLPPVGHSSNHQHHCCQLTDNRAVVRIVIALLGFSFDSLSYIEAKNLVNLCLLDRASLW